MNIIFKNIIILFLSFLFAISSAAAEELDKRWIYFATNRTGCNFYYDADSIVYLPDNIVKVWQKMVCPQTAQSAVSEMTTLKEIDCTRRTYRQLQMGGARKDGSFIFDFETSSQYDEIWPESWMENFYKTVCKRKAIRN
jgi:hypothetical protein